MKLIVAMAMVVAASAQAQWWGWNGAIGGGPYVGAASWGEVTAAVVPDGSGADYVYNPGAADGGSGLWVGDFVDLSVSWAGAWTVSSQVGTDYYPAGDSYGSADAAFASLGVNPFPGLTLGGGVSAAGVTMPDATNGVSTLARVVQVGGWVLLVPCIGAIAFFVGVGVYHSFFKKVGGEYVIALLLLGVGSAQAQWGWWAPDGADYSSATRYDSLAEAVLHPYDNFAHTGFHTESHDIYYGADGTVINTDLGQHALLNGSAVVNVFSDDGGSGWYSTGYTSGGVYEPGGSGSTWQAAVEDGYAKGLVFSSGMGLAFDGQGKLAVGVSAVVVTMPDATNGVATLAGVVRSGSQVLWPVVVVLVGLMVSVGLYYRFARKAGIEGSYPTDSQLQAYYSRGDSENGPIDSGP